MIPTLNLPPEKFVQPQRNDEAQHDIKSVAGLFTEALSSPIGFPPISNLLFEGDKIVFVVLNELQAKADCVSALLGHLLTFVQPCQIEILSSLPLDIPEPQQQDLIDQFKNKDVELNFEVHDKDDEHHSAYLAASFAAEPIYINRKLFDADTVIPITTPDSVDADGRPCVYPEFSKSETLKRHEQSNPDEIRGEARIAHESIGICFVIEVTVGPGGEIQHVQSGEFSRVANQDRQASQSAWQIKRSADARVVVATIESPETGQTWDHFFRAMMAAAAASENVQQIVICCRLDKMPADLHHHLLQIPFESDYDALQQVLQNIPDNYRAIPGIFEEATVYLKSGLPEDDVEELGLGYIASDADIQRIVDNAPSGIYLRDAHLCKIADED